jgi:hypothetical protein
MGKLQMKIFLFSILIVLVCVVAGSFSSAKTVPSVDQNDENYCQPFYEKIQKVYFSYSESLPFSSEIDWNKVVEHVKHNHGFVLQNEKIPFIFTRKKPEEVLSNDPDALYIKILYSYLFKNKLSTPLNADYLVSWIEIYKKQDNKISSRTTKATFLEIDNRQESHFLEVTSGYYGFRRGVFESGQRQF